jgi:hypothetical protein
LLTCPKISLLLKTSLSKAKDGVFIMLLELLDNAIYLCFVQYIMLSGRLSRTYKNFRKLLILSGVHLGGGAPCQKMGIYKPKAYFQGGWENI